MPDASQLRRVASDTVSKARRLQKSPRITHISWGKMHVEGTPMIIKDPKAQVIEMLDGCLQGKECSITVLRNLVSRSDLDKDVAMAAHELQHFVDDQDIRQQDEQHEEYWRERLRQIREKVSGPI